MWRALPSCQSSSIQSTTTIPRSNEVDMEAQTEYRVGGFHPIELGDVLNTRYRVVRKLGYGRYLFNGVACRGQPVLQHFED